MLLVCTLIYYLHTRLRLAKCLPLSEPSVILILMVKLLTTPNCLPISVDRQMFEALRLKIPVTFCVELKLSKICHFYTIITVLTCCRHSAICIATRYGL